MTRTLSVRRLVVITAVGVAALVAALTGGAALQASRSRAATVGQLSSQLRGQHARQQSLAAGVASLSRFIASLDSQITLLRSREAAVRADLARERTILARVRGALVHERGVIVVLKGRLALARRILARQLVSSYEADRPDLMSVVLDARGFTDLLERLNFLSRARRQQQSIITATRSAKAAADAAARHLARLEAQERAATSATETRVRALVAMDGLLASREAALSHAREAQQAAFDASREKGRQLEAAISRLRAQQAAARAAAAAAAAARTPTPTSTGPALGPSGGWAIPYAIVLCESGGQNLTPNSAGASGYYQILPATWKLFGGTGPAAYLASKSAQDAVAARIWNSGAGASNWVCAAIVGIR